MLEVKVAEISRTELKRMNAQFNLINLNSKWNLGGVNGGASFPDAVFSPGSVRAPVFAEAAPFGPMIDEFAPNPLNIQNQGLFASFLTSNTLFNLVLDAAKEKGLAKILAEPTLTTLTGQEANFLSGGEFPIPVPQGDRGITVQFKEFGVGLKFIPVVLDEETINIKLNISVSELINSNTIGIAAGDSTSSFIIPSLSTRSANATVELKEGQTIGIAGLISENLRQTITKFPGLGDIPVLGTLFRSQDFINNESELVIVVTPHIAKPMNPQDIRLPTDKFVEPSDTDFYLMGRMEGRTKESENSPDPSGGTDSNFGHRVE
jgi:pilus assembly protein CpaC